MKYFIIIIFFYFPLNIISQQKVEVLQQGREVSLRGLSVVSDNIFWVSGSKGTVGRSINGGKTIEWFTVKDFEKSDFRDIQAFDSTTAIIMAVAEPAYILKTIDAGKNWKIVYENHTKGMFLDAMDFEPNNKKGMVVGDALEGKIFLAETFDAGDTWQENVIRPASIDQEGCFASSGTNIVLHKKDAFYVTGGKNSRFFKNENAMQIPISQGLETTGANSIAVAENGKNIIIVGGDFKNQNNNTDNCLVSKNGGKSFNKSNTNPTGYRSCVEFTGRKTAISCGLNGVDISKDGGRNWLNISNESFHVCQKARVGEAIYLAGTNGKIGRLNNPK